MGVNEDFQALPNRRAEPDSEMSSGKLDAPSPNLLSSGMNVKLLTDLPPELLLHIMEYLVPEYPEIGETRPVTYDKLVPEEPWFDITRNRRGLHSLCLTSRGLCGLAQPLLYRVIPIVDVEGMMLLFRALSERPALGGHSRYLSCHLTLTRPEVIRETRATVMRLANTIRPSNDILYQYPGVGGAIWSLRTSITHLSHHTGDFNDIPQVLLFFIANFMGNLETFLVQVPIQDEHAEYTALFEKFESWVPVRRDGRDGPVDDQSRTIPNPLSTGPKPLQNLKTLLLQGDPELLMHFDSDECDCDVPELYGCQARRYYPIFKHLPALTTLEVSGDDGVWEAVLRRRSQPEKSRRHPPYLQTIKHLYLHDSVAYPRDLHHILANAPNLHTLYLTPRPDPEPYPDEDFMGLDEHPESLDAALSKFSRHLRHLDVAWWDLREFTNTLGPEGRLPSLTSLGNLEKLCIQLCVLYGTDPAALLSPLSSFLPPNLVELTLAEWWWEDIEAFDQSIDWTSREKITHYQSKTAYRAQAIAILSRFAADCGPGQQMQKLKKVTFQTKFSYTWRMDGFVTTESHFAGVKKMFGERGVRFTVEEDDDDIPDSEGDSWGLPG